MAHFAQLDENNKVLQVIVVSNQEITEHGVEVEAKGIEFCKSLLGESTNWVQTSYNSQFRKHYAGIGYIYDPIGDRFIPPSPFPSWVLNEDCFWEPLVPMPIDDKRYTWDEETFAWVEV